MTSRSHNNYYDSAFFASSHAPVSSKAIWHDIDLLPGVTPLPTPIAYPGSAVSNGIVRGILEVPLTQDSSFPLEFSATIPGQVENVILPYVGLEAYTPILKDSNNAVIPYNPKVWYIHSTTGLVVFCRKTPLDLGYTNTLTLTYWKYVGTASGIGSAASTGGGTDIYTGMSGDIAQFRSMHVDVASGLSISTSTNANAITIANTVVGVNVGSASEDQSLTTNGIATFYAGKDFATGALKFKSLKAGNNIHIVQTTTNDIEIHSIDPAEVSIFNDTFGTSEVAGGVYILGAPLNLDTAVARVLTHDIGISITKANQTSSGNGDFHDILFKNTGVVSLTSLTTTDSGVSTVRALTTGSINATTGNVDFYSLAASTATNMGGCDIIMSADTKTLIVQNTLTGLNVGTTWTGVADTTNANLFVDKTTNHLNFRSLIAGSRCTLTTTGNNITIDVQDSAYSVSNSTGGTADAVIIDAGLTGSGLVYLKTFAKGVGIDLTNNAHDIVIASTVIGQNLSGSGTPIYVGMGSAGNAGNLQFNSVTVDTTGLGLGISGGLITLSCLLTGNNNSTGTVQVYANKSNSASAPTLNFRSITQGGGMSISQDASTITIANNGVANAISATTAASGLPVLASFTAGGTATFKNVAVVASSGLSSATSTSTDIILQNTMTGSNLGGSGQSIYVSKNGTTGALEFNTINVATDGLSITTTSNVVTISNPLAGNNLGTGAQIYKDKTNHLTTPTLNFRSIVQGSGMTIGQSNTDITITNNGIITVANTTSGATTPGEGVWNGTTGTVATFKCIAANKASGLTLSATGTDIEIICGLTGANPGSSGQPIFIQKTTDGAGLGVLQFNKIAGTSNGLTVSAPSSGVITIDCTLAGASNGGGTAVYANKTGATLNFNTLAPGSGIDVSLATSLITISSKQTTWVAFESQSSGLPPTGSSVTNIANASVWQTRILNTLQTQSTGFATGNVALNTTTYQLTLAPGVYFIEGACPANATNTHCAAFATVAGTSPGNIAVKGQLNRNSNNSQVSTSSFCGIVVVSVSTAYVVRQYFTQTVAGGLGLALGSGNEIYSYIKITQLS